ncbi:trypsin-like peptidase domain-containing protein [Oscillospiraceae bacterium MB08-C2-2]|nr:trypsin-like peptidase domain-containing protein [Oscillospiraceae bacterium MB08-C2-2]
MNDQFNRPSGQGSAGEDSGRGADSHSGSTPGFNPPPQGYTRQGGWQAPGGQYQGSGGYSNNGNGQQRPPYYQYGNYQQNPYQAPPNSGNGWQQPSAPGPQKEQPKYQWNFEDYDRLDPIRKRGKKNRGLVVFGVAVLLLMALALVFVSGFGIYNYMSFDSSVAEAGPGSSSPDTAVPDDKTDESLPAVNRDDSVQLEIESRPEEAVVDGKMTIPQVAQAVLPSVVGVVKYERTDFYEPTGVGSGIIMTESGYIVTNAHVVENASDIKIILHNGDPYPAVLVGTDRQTDLAVLKIEAEGLVPAVFGDSTQVVVGETVLAIGNPAGLELAGSVTQGIVSAVDRIVRTTTYTMNYIQTDAAINPGNSGGALVNEYGQVIGINSSKIFATGFEGLGFAIPVADAQPIINDLISHGRVTGRVVLNITAREVDEYDVRKYGVPLGLRVETVNQNVIPGENTLQKNDIITHIAGERVTNFDEVKTILKQHKAGDIVTLTVYRQITSMQSDTFEVQLALVEDQS